MQIAEVTPPAASPAAFFRPAQRGTYGELVQIGGPRSVAAILDFLRPSLPARRVNFDKHQRGEAVNHDLYGWDDEDQVGVVQVRMAFRRYKQGFLSTRKEYVLCGFNENGEPFRHPVGSAAIHGAIKAGGSPVDVVRAAQRWMWQVTAKQLDNSYRQGDVLIVPERKLPAGATVEEGAEARLADTHRVLSDRIATLDGRLYAVLPQVVHTKGQHRPVQATFLRGEWFSVRVARESPAWDFSARMGD